MVKPSTLYTRRLSKLENGLWWNLYDPWSNLVPKEVAEGYLDAFVGLSGALLYLSSVGGSPVGGTAAFHDSDTRTLSLLSVRMKPGFRKGFLFPIVKSSLPFFRSTSIVQVETLVSQSNIGDTIPFPFSFVLQPWLAPILQANGFQKAEQLSRCTIENISAGKDGMAQLQWNPHPNSAAVNAFVREEAGESGLSCSQARLAVSLSAGARSLKTISVEGQILALAGFSELDKRAVASVIMYDREKLDVGRFAAAIVSLCIRTKAKSLDLLLVGPGQRDLTNSLSEMSGSRVKQEPVFMMRKVL